MDRIMDRVWISNAHEAMQPELLRANGIEAVCNATKETDNLQEFKDQHAYIRLDQDDGQEWPPETLDRFLDWMSVQDAAFRVVDIHCGAGVSRASSLAIAWLMHSEGLSWDDAESLVRSRRPVIQPHPNLKSSILRYFGQDYVPVGA